jgi:TIR domain
LFLSDYGFSAHNRSAMPKIFISYRREDSEYLSGIIARRLSSAFGQGSIVIDVDNIPPGEDFRVYIRGQLHACDLMIAVIGRHWLTAADEQGKRRLDNSSDWVRLELEAALARETKIPVIPVLLDNIPPPRPEQLPKSLKELAFRQAHRIRPAADFEHDVDRLVEWLKTHEQRQDVERLARANEQKRRADEGQKEAQAIEEERRRQQAAAEAEKTRLEKERREAEQRQSARIAREAAMLAEKKHREQEPVEVGRAEKIETKGQARELSEHSSRAVRGEPTQARWKAALAALPYLIAAVAVAGALLILILKEQAPVLPEKPPSSESKELSRTSSTGFVSKTVDPKRGRDDGSLAATQGRNGDGSGGGNENSAVVSSPGRTLSDVLQPLAKAILDFVVVEQKQNAIAVGDLFSPSSGLDAKSGHDINEALKSLLESMRPGIVNQRASLSLRGRYDKTKDPTIPDVMLIKLTVEIVDASGNSVGEKFVEIRDTDAIAARLRETAALPSAPSRSDHPGGLVDSDMSSLPPQTGVLLSCSRGEYSFENRAWGRGHGAFFYQVIEGLNGTATDQEGDVTWDSLRTYVKTQVPKAVRKIYGKDGGEQNPNEMGNLVGPPVVLASAAGKSDRESDGRRLAFLVGVRQFDHNALRDLEFSDNDVIDLARVLESKGFKVVLLATEVAKKSPELAPTSEHIRMELAELLKTCTKRDLIVVGLSGAGFQPIESGQSYFLPQDADPSIERGRPKRPDTLIGIVEILNMLRKSVVGTKLLLVDACRNDPNLDRGR